MSDCKRSTKAVASTMKIVTDNDNTATTAATLLDINSYNLKFANKTLQDYEVLSVIGNGAFGTCYKVRDKQSGELYAWKGMDYDELSDEQKDSLISEISVLRQLQHPNIVQYYHHLVNQEAKSIYIVMECCEGGDLAQLIAKARVERKRFEEKYIWRVLFQICKAVQVCHNKIKQGTILHRDIKPANIFLDIEGNAKLGDFGLARVLARDEHFAATFVGTPYYMSPEIVKGTKYDRKSDVWAVGCLIYEMCALRTPFKGREFEQLSANISNGKFSSIPDIYTTDLQEIISFMLNVDNDQRPGIEIISRHPIVVRNINDLGNEYPKLIEIEKDFYVVTGTMEARCKLNYSPLRELSSTMYTEQYSFNEGYGQRRLSISGVFTPDLRAELYYSAKRRNFRGTSAAAGAGSSLASRFQQSDQALYESIKRADYASIVDSDNSVLKCAIVNKHNKELSPNVVTQNIFEHALQERLHAIRAQESLLKQRTEELDAREQKLNDQEKRLQELERNLHEKMKAASSTVGTLERARLPLPNELKQQLVCPPVPLRRSLRHDDTYCTIEPNDTLLQAPTVAKLNLAALPPPKSLPNLRKVTFQSPQKCIKSGIENVPSAKIQAPSLSSGSGSSGGSTQMQTSVSSKASSDDSADIQTSTHRRKSILSLLGLSRSKDSTKAALTPLAPTAPRVPLTHTTLKQTTRPPLATKAQEQQLLMSKTLTSELANMWTKEQKRAAFDLLAAMNAAEQDSNGQRIMNGGYRNKIRYSVREKNTLQRNRMRRSVMLVGGGQQQQLHLKFPTHCTEELKVLSL